MDPQTQVSPLVSSADFCQQAVLLHHLRDRLGIMVNSLRFHPDVHASIAVGLKTMRLMPPGFLCQRYTLFYAADTFDIVVVAALGYAEVSTHHSDGVLFPMPVYDFVLYLRSDIPSVRQR